MVNTNRIKKYTTQATLKNFDGGDVIHVMESDNKEYIAFMLFKNFTFNCQMFCLGGFDFFTSDNFSNEEIKEIISFWAKKFFKPLCLVDVCRRDAKIIEKTFPKVTLNGEYTSTNQSKMNILIINIDIYE